MVDRKFLLILEDFLVRLGEGAGEGMLLPDQDSAIWYICSMVMDSTYDMVAAIS